MKIGVRLTLCFIAIVSLMFASYLFTLWQFDAVRKQEDRVHQLDQESRAVLNVHTTLLALRDGLEDLTALQDSSNFATQIAALRTHFLREVDAANQALRAPRSEGEHDPSILSTLDAIQSSVPNQIDALTDLAKIGDWSAVQLRIHNQVTPLSSLTSQLVERVDVEVNEDKAEAHHSIQILESRVFAMQLVTAFVTLVVAGLLGTLVTRSITRPLARLQAGSEALASGDFRHRVAVGGDDELAHLTTVFNDTTHRLHVLYGALKSSEERFRRVVAAAPVGIAVLDDNSTIRFFNSRFLEITGIGAEQAQGMRLTDPNIAVFREDGMLCPTDERPSQKAVALKKPVLNQVARQIHPVTGQSLWVLVSAWPVLRADGSVDQVITTLTDITEQKRIEDELRSGRELLAQAQRAGQLGCFDLNLKTNTVAWSAELADLFGLAPGTRAGQHHDWEELVYSEDRSHAAAGVEAALKYGESVAEYRICRRSDGQIRWVESRAKVLRDDAGQPERLVGVTMDITERKSAEHTLLQMSNRLLHIQEEEQRRIAREVHDSTSQEMTALTLNLGALRASAASLPQNARAQIAESLALAKRVAREIRTFSYLLHPPMLNELGLWAALRMFLEEFRERSGLKVTAEIPKEVETQILSSDQEMAVYRFVQEALANVHRHSGSKTASVIMKVANHTVEASVGDTGRGIPKELLKQIRETSGLAGGVGLAGMHERIGYVGGRVQIDSDEHGTTVAAFIPLDTRAAAGYGGQQRSAVNAQYRVAKAAPQSRE
jgi:PAS domain S-box-containing protein